MSFIASITAMAAGVEALQLAAKAPVVGHDESPPPVTLAVLIAPVALAALAATVTGISTITVPLLTPAANVQPTVVLPLVGQPLKVLPVLVPPVTTGAPLKVMPVGKLSIKFVGKVVGPFATVNVTIYFCPVASTAKTGALATVLFTVKLGAAPAVTLKLAVSHTVWFGDGAHNV